MANPLSARSRPPLTPRHCPLGPQVPVSVRAGLQFCLPPVGGDGRPQSERASPVTDPGASRRPTWAVLAERRALRGAPSVLWKRRRGSLEVSVLADAGLQARLAPVSSSVESAVGEVLPRRLRKGRRRRVGEENGAGRRPPRPHQAQARVHGSAESRRRFPVKCRASHPVPAPPPTCCVFRQLASSL